LGAYGQGIDTLLLRPTPKNEVATQFNKERLMLGTVDQTVTQRVLGISTIKERMDRWLDYAKSQGIELDRILVHPKDLPHCPKCYRGLPVETFKDSRMEF